MPIPKTPQKMFETRSHAWQEVGLLRQINPRVVKRAGLEAVCWCRSFIAVVVLYNNRLSLLGTAVPGRPGHPAHLYSNTLETSSRRPPLSP